VELFSVQLIMGTPPSTATDGPVAKAAILDPFSPVYDAEASLYITSSTYVEIIENGSFTQPA
jgi:hypothetical protein